MSTDKDFSDCNDFQRFISIKGHLQFCRIYATFIRIKSNKIVYKKYILYKNITYIKKHYNHIQKHKERIEFCNYFYYKFNFFLFLSYVFEFCYL